MTNLRNSPRSPSAGAAWQAFRARGTAIITAGTPQPPPGGRLVFRAVALPARRGLPTTWELFAVLDRRREIDHYSAVRTEWDITADSAQSWGLATPEESERCPTIARSTIPIAMETAKTLLADLSKVTVPIAPGPHPYGVDGVTYHLKMGDGFASATFKWWVSGPEAWLQLVTTFHAVWDVLEGLK